MQKVHTRRDIATKLSYPKEELVRFTINDGKIVLGRDDGRGYYLLRSEEALRLAIAKKAFTRILHREISEEEVLLFKEAICTKR